MKLCLITTIGLGDFYVVASNPTEAENEIEMLLDKADYGFSGERKVVNIKLLAHELSYFPKDRPSFRERGHELIIVKHNP